MSMIVGFIGLGNMGMPMAEQLMKAGHTVQALDLVRGAAGQGRRIRVPTVRIHRGERPKGPIWSLPCCPQGQHVRKVYLGDGGLVETAAPGTLLIDSSTIDVDTSREVGTAAVAKGLEMIDAPVTGGVMAARIGKLNFIVGGTEASFARAKPYLEIMGGNLLYAGEQGSGIGVKICNNMSLGHFDDRCGGNADAGQTAWGWTLSGHMRSSPMHPGRTGH